MFRKLLACLPCDTFEEQLEIVKLKTWQRQTSTLNVNENDVQDPLWYKHW